MQIADMPSPGFIPNGIRLRTEMYRALSYAAIQSEMTEKRSDCAGNLADFLQACADEARKHATPVTPAPKATKATA